MQKPCSPKHSSTTTSTNTCTTFISSLTGQLFWSYSKSRWSPEVNKLDVKQPTASKHWRCAQVNSASDPLRDGNWVEVYELRGEGLVWLIKAVVCLCAAPQVQLLTSAGNGWPHNAPRYHQLMPISCHFRDCKALLVMCSHVSSTSTRPLPFYL